jgi:hypothetical protein
MVRRALIVLIAALLVALPLTGALSQPSKETAPSPVAFSVLVEQILALFPKVTGEVIEVQDKTVTLSLGRRDGLPRGIELEVYREGRELRHPRTGEVLGRTELEVGRVAVDQVFEAYSVGRLTRGGEIRPGDRARVSAGKLKLTLLPLVSGVKENLVEAAIQDLVEGLNRSGRFHLSMGDQINVWLSQQGIKAEDAIQGKGLGPAAERFKVETLLAVHFTRVQNKPYMEVRLYALPGAPPLLSTALFVPPSIKPAVQGPFSAGPGVPARQAPPPRQRSLLARILGGDLDAGTYSSGESSIPLREVARFGFPVLAMDVSVSPRDKLPRVVITEGEKVYLYRLVNRALEPEWTYSVRASGRIFSVQLADLDGDGVFEVLVNRHHPEPSIGLNSFILTTRGGKAAVVAQDLSVILLAVDTTGEGVRRTLWGQPYSLEAFFAKGQAGRYALKGGSLVPDGVARVPMAFRATGAVMANIGGKGTRSLAFIDESNRLQIAFEVEEVWRSSSAVGGGGHLRLEVVKYETRGGTSVYYNMEPPPLAVDLDGDGIDEIVVPQNQVPGQLAVVFRGPAGYRIQSVNSGFEGIITGLGALPGEDAPTLVASVVRFKNLFKTAGETQIIMTTSE